ncbi:MAG: hypothetical protein KAX57_06230 [Rhodoferax sp.]|nr:hypothetical protein [Rhodoferax sp.]
MAKYASLAAAAGLDWPTIQGLSETALERQLVGGQRSPVPVPAARLRPHPPGAAPQGHDADAAVAVR